MMYGWNDGGWGFFWMILSWVVIIAVVVLLVRALAGGSWSRGSDSRREPDEILDERFARGEISEEEYRDRRRVLKESRR